MIWTACFYIALAIFVATVVCSIVNTRPFLRKRKTNIKPVQVLFVGVFITSAILFFPAYRSDYIGKLDGVLTPLLWSVFSAIRVFMVDIEYEYMFEKTAELTGMFGSLYTAFSTAVFFIAPILTFGVLLSFFENISAYQNYLLHYNTDTYVFSVLNERSLILAESIIKKNKKSIIVFTDVNTKNGDGINQELIYEAKKMGAVSFSHDILSINFSVHGKNAQISFFTIGEDESENSIQAIKLINKYSERENTSLYSFSISEESAVLLNSVEWNKMHVFRVNEVRSLIVQTLYANGEMIFQDAIDNGNEKMISAVIVGLGRHGTEMLKAMTWLCQMDGYNVTIDVFDVDEHAKSKFTAICPELMSDEYNNVFRKGDAHYNIRIHSGIDVDTKEFVDAISALTGTTYVLVSLGNDADNIRTAVNMRSAFERIGISPRMQAIVYSSEKAIALESVHNFKKQTYNIDFIGDLNTSFSEKVIINSTLEQLALARHMRYSSNVEPFWRYEYNYRSSMASAIHKKMRIACKMRGADKPLEDRTEEEKDFLRVIEHSRWNAYMRSEGYSHADVRNDLAKTHNCLVPYDDLPHHEKEKDDD